MAKKITLFVDHVEKNKNKKIIQRDLLLTWIILEEFTRVCKASVDIIRLSHTHTHTLLLIYTLVVSKQMFKCSHVL